MKLWIDDMKPAPEGYAHAKSVNEAKNILLYREALCATLLPNSVVVDIIDIDHNAGNYASDGGHYIKLLEWLEETGRNYPIHIHSDNQINLLWMREIIERNGWKEV